MHVFCQLTLVDYQWLIYASAKCDISRLIISIMGFIDFENLAAQKNDKYHPYAVVYVHMNESIMRNMLCYKPLKNLRNRVYYSTMSVVYSTVCTLV